jgi:lauroyl/myristoyl acyltransferase
MASIKALAFPAGTFLLRFIPRHAAIMFGYLVADVCGLVCRARRRAIDQNLVRTCPDVSARERGHLRRATFRHFAGTWIDFLRVPFLAREAILSLVRWQTRENLDAALERGNGVVIVTAHVGALDLAGIYLAAHGYPVSVVVEDIDPDVYRVWSRYRGSTGMRVLSRRTGAVAAYRTLERGDIVALVSDRVIDGPGLEVDFCGDRRVVPTGPAAFALRSGASVILLQMTRRSDGSGYDLVTEPAKVTGETIEDLTRSINSELVRIIRRFPEQWFVFQPNWLGAHEEANVA